MYCPNCKKVYSSEYKGNFCGDCGTRLVDSPKQNDFGVNISDDAAIGYDNSTVKSNIAPDCDGLRESYVLLQKPNGSYYWARIHMMPASNVYFEESFAPPVISDYKDWSMAGSSAGLSQSLSGASDVYGYDAAYASGSSYSNGISKFVTVDSENNRSDTLKFDFTGTGIDIVATNHCPIK